MKQTAILLLGILVITACKKDNTAAIRSQIAGKWEYITFGGYPFNNTVYPAGNGRIIIIGNDGSFERRAHDTLLFKGHYTLDARKDCYGSDKKVFFIHNDSLFVKDDYIEVINGELNISSPNCYQDGGTSTWRKL